MVENVLGCTYNQRLSIEGLWTNLNFSVIRSLVLHYFWIFPIFSLQFGGGYEGLFWYLEGGIEGEPRKSAVSTKRTSKESLQKSQLCEHNNQIVVFCFSSPHLDVI